MSRIPVHTLDTAPKASQDTLGALKKQFGKILNFHGEMAHAPVVMAAYAGIQAAIIEHGTFDPRTREAIALAVGATDNCHYCQSAHTAAGIAVGWSLDQTVAIRTGDPVDGKLDTLLAVARRLAADVGEVDDATWQAALEAGWTDEELAELYTHVLANVYTNYFNHNARTELDVPAAPPLT